jgi:hypothetical protein
MVHHAGSQLLPYDQHHHRLHRIHRSASSTQKKTKVKSTKTCSETESISSSQSIETKEKSKVWTSEEVELFGILLRKYGTDFHILSAFFPKKTKNQLKVTLSSLRTDTNST